MSKKLKIFLIFFIFLFFLVPLIIYSIPTEKSLIVKKIKELIPLSLKQKLKDTIFIIPELSKTNKEQERKIKSLQLKFNSLQLEVRDIKSETEGIITDKLAFQIKRFPLPIHKYTSDISKNVAYIENIENKIFIVSGTGETMFVNKTDIFGGSALNFNNIKNNIKTIVKDEAFYDIKNKTIIINDSKFNYRLGNSISIKDLLIYENIVYLSYTKEIKDNCYNTAIVSAKLNYNFLKFKEFFSPKKCNPATISSYNKTFNGHLSGGRMVIYNQGKFLLLTIGSYGTMSGVQDDKTTFGKIVSIDIKSKQYSIISTGHRNPQGLIYLPDEDVILSTEHGPKGGDELNKIKAGKNYGWPVSSYGVIYNDNLTEWGPKYNSHKDHGFEEPIHYFVPSIGISQIIKVPGAFSEKWANNILITSLTGSTPYGNHSHDSHNIISDTAGYSIYRAVLNEKYDKLISLERILLGERIRDIIYEKDNNVFLMILENSPSLGVLSVKK